MNVAVMKTKAETALGEQFAAVAGRLPGGAWVKDLRRKAIGAFEALGLPHRRIEEWKYTDLRERMREAFPPVVAEKAAVSAQSIDAALGPLASLAADRLVFVDGAFRADLSDVKRLGDAVELKSMAEMLAAAPAWLQGKFDVQALTQQDATRVLNLAFMSDGVLLKVKPKQATARPVLLVSARSGEAAGSIATRNIVAVEAGGALTLIEAQVALPGASAKAQTNAVTDITLADGANVAHIKCLVDGGDTTHLSTWVARIGKAASYRAFQLTAATGLARNQLFVTFTGEAAKLDISGLFLARRNEHIDTTLVVDHAVPGCESRELFKGVLDDRARGIVQGKVIVRPHAQKSDGKQMAQALMLSPDAEFDSKPELEIFADDVVCGHGSTCAEIDADLLFYCRSRGIPLAEARAMLIESFTAEAIDKVEDEKMRAVLMDIAKAWLSGS